MQRPGGAIRSLAAGQPRAWICKGHGLLDGEMRATSCYCCLNGLTHPPVLLFFNVYSKDNSQEQKKAYKTTGYLKYQETIVKRNWQMLYTCKLHGRTSHVRCTCWDTAARCRCCLRPIHLGLCSSTDSSGNVWRWTLKPITML